VAVDHDLDPAVPTGRDDRSDRSGLHRLSQVIGVVAAIGNDDPRLGSISVEQGDGACVIGRLAGRDLYRYGQTFAVGAEVNLCREATPRAAETLSRSPPFAPAAQWCARTTVLSII